MRPSHRLPTPSLLIATVISVLVSFSLASPVDRRATVIPAPYSFTPAQNWDGNDGPWNSFWLRVGTPAQYVRVMASTVSQQTWVVGVNGCLANGFSDCRGWRGELFNYTTSSTWLGIGNYSLWIEQNLGYDGGARYGHDKVALGVEGEGGPTLEDQVVGVVGGENFYMGHFGLHPKPTNFSHYDERDPSYMSSLKDQGIIPSLSYGYTAGAQYRFRTVLSSLTLGGYDTSRFIPNDLSIGFAPDNERELVIAVQSITMTDSKDTRMSLLPNPIYSFIDSTIAQIWLPIAACRLFEQAFGLVYDNATELYLVSSDLHQKLLDQNAEITFTVAGGKTGGPSVDLVFPYAAFDKIAKPPFRRIANETRYFPLRQAQNESQYTLGRTFLQEAYLIVDHERMNFSVSAINWTDGSPSHLVPILAANFSDSPSSSSSLAGGAIAGIVIGSVAAVGLLIFAALFYRRRKRAAEKQVQPRAPSATPTKFSTTSSEKDDSTDLVIPKAELDATSTVAGKARMDFYGPDGEAKSRDPTNPNSPVDGTMSRAGTLIGAGTLLGSDAGMVLVEADGKERAIYEMPGDLPTLNEADSRGLSEKEAMMARERVYNGVDPNPASADGDAVARSPTEGGNVSPMTPTQRSTGSMTSGRSWRKGGRRALDASEVVPVRRARTYGNGSSEGHSPVSPVSGSQGSTQGSRPSRGLSEGTRSEGILSPLSPLEGTVGFGGFVAQPTAPRRRFSWEEPLDGEMGTSNESSTNATSTSNENSTNATSTNQTFTSNSSEGEKERKSGDEGPRI